MQPYPGNLEHRIVTVTENIHYNQNNLILNIMKNLVYSLIIILSGLLQSDMQAQTNVSGSIHSDVTWTLSNSPYHVTSDIYVFPGVTLTVEPGVKVIFDGDYTLEIRGKIMANGNSANPIYFCGKMIVSGSDTFYALWRRVYLEPNNKGTGEFEYCVFRDAATALTAGAVKSKVSHCVFEDNQVALDGYNIYNSSNQLLDNCVFQYNGIAVQYAQNTVFKSCVFSSNDQGMYDAFQSRIINCTFDKNRNGLNIYNGCIYNSTFTRNGHGIKAPNFDGGAFSKIDTIKGCTIEENSVGIEDSADGAGMKVLIINNSISKNTIGYIVNYAGDLSGTYVAMVKNNKICNNTQYNVVNHNNQNKNFTDNCFCTDDSSVIEDKLYDGYDDPNLGLLTYNIYDASCKHKKHNTFKNLPVEDKDTGCLNFAECESYTLIKSPKKNVHSLNIYPNPSSDVFTIVFDAAIEGVVNIYDQYGRAILNVRLEPSTNGQMTIDASEWNAGVYRVEIVQQGRTSVGSVIKI